MSSGLNGDKIHLKAPKNWINDPNGFIYYQGMYHLFYQHFPYAPMWGTMHWGHAVSKDLVSWEHQDVAVFPSRYEDQNGCYSGSAVEHEGRMYLFYTGIHYDKINPENIHICPEMQFEASQLVIVSDDGFTFDNFQDKHVAIPVITDPAKGDKVHTRDPKVWRGKDAWYMILGSSIGYKRGRALLYKSKNLFDWKFINSVSKPEGFGWMWECPDFFETAGGSVLMLSTMGILQGDNGTECQTICTVVDFDEETCKMDIPDNYQYFDHGFELYAPQSAIDAEGRRVVVAWLRMPEPVDGKWSGMFCIPRVVEVREGHIYFRVHPNVEKQYRRQISSAAESAEAGYKVSMKLADGEGANIGGYQILRRGNRVYTDKTAVAKRKEGERRQFETPEMREDCYLDVYVDSHLIEVFVNDGEYVISNAVYGLGSDIQADEMQNVKIFTVGS